MTPVEDLEVAEVCKHALSRGHFPASQRPKLKGEVLKTVKVHDSCDNLPHGYVQLDDESNGQAVKDCLLDAITGKNYAARLDRHPVLNPDLHHQCTNRSRGYEPGPMEPVKKRMLDLRVIRIDPLDVCPGRGVHREHETSQGHQQVVKESKLHDQHEEKLHADHHLLLLICILLLPNRMHSKANSERKPELNGHQRYAEDEQKAWIDMQLVIPIQVHGHPAKRSN
mmetsp:Transcript_73463/g.132288  ORF Transcript_73463/g.132288 Transcript_73463/m.132288 type:complete len:225 (+) Transcript_73463:323-997(+)